MSPRLCALSVALSLARVVAASAETVDVKYKGPVDVSSFTCTPLPRSSFIRRVCYDTPKRYMILDLNGTHYEFCAVGPSDVADLIGASSAGRHFNTTIKGRFNCR